MTQFVLAVVLGLLFAVGTFLLLRRDVVRVAWGVVIVSQSANVYLVTMGGLDGPAPIIAHGAEGGPTPTDPLVQALVLTAIVIGFGTTAFLLVLTYRVYQEHGTIDAVEIGGLDAGSPGDGLAGERDSAVTTDGGQGEAALDASSIEGGVERD